MQSDNILAGVQVVELGEAQGHDFTITPAFLSRVVELGNQKPVKVRLNHPEGRGDVSSIVGEASNFRLDGDCVRADVTLFDLPEKPRLLTLARQAGHLFGMSIDFAGEVVKKAGNKLKEMTCEAIFGVDFVDTPAATRALFSAGETKNRWRVSCALSLPKVDGAEQAEEHDMAKDPTKKQLAEDAPPAPVEQKHPEPDGDEGQDKVLTALAVIEKRLAALEAAKDGEKKVEMGDEPPAEDEEKEEAMATMAAKVCSIMLSKVGIPPRKASAPADQQESDEYQLSADEAKLAKSLGIDAKQFAANLKRAQLAKA